MLSKSYTNLRDLAEGNLDALGGGRAAGGGLRRMPRSRTEPGALSDLDEDDGSRSDVAPSSDVQSSAAAQERVIIVSNQLPIIARRRPGGGGSGGGGWSFAWDEDSLLLQLKDGIPEDMEVVHVGLLRADIPAAEQDDVSQVLFDRFRCAPVFLPEEVFDKYYHGFCKRHLWPLLHYMLPFSSPFAPAAASSAPGERFDRAAWEGYVQANRSFFEKVVEVINPDDDYVWVHDYQLMVLPSFLRRRFLRLRIGFFLHSPFPSSEIYRTIPVREEILKALLNCDLIGFHTFDYARHFLSCCTRMLGIDYQSKRGFIGLEYFGRTVGIKIMPVGIHMGQLQSVLCLPDRMWRVSELQQQLKGRTVLLGVDDMDIFKGINLKLLAFEHMLRTHRKWQGRAVLIQIASAACDSHERDLSALHAEIQDSADRINAEFGRAGYSPVILIDHEVTSAERAAYYSIAECVVVTAVRDGLNLTPYEYVACRQGVSSGSEDDPESAGSSIRKSMLVVSEFIGCSPSLSGAIRVNPWNIEATGEAMHEAISKSDAEKQLRHEKHYLYVSKHDVAYWSRSFMQDLVRACKEHFAKRCWGVGIGFGFRVVALDPNFTKLNVDDIVSAYNSANSRAILLDYDGTLVQQTTLNKMPSAKVVKIINKLCGDSRNVVFVVSGRGRVSLGEWFAGCPRLGIAAEHGYLMRWGIGDEWVTSTQTSSFEWMQMAEPVLNLYTEATDGSYIETKESALVWHHQDADPVFGPVQAKELLDHLESVLANEPVAVKTGQFIVEVKPQAVGKGYVAEKILSAMNANGKQADFVLCIGDDRSDEDMFESITEIIKKRLVASNTALFGCTVGQKPSKARFYLDDTSDVISMLEALAAASDSSGQPEEEGQEQEHQLARALSTASAEDETPRHSVS